MHEYSQPKPKYANRASGLHSDCVHCCEFRSSIVRSRLCRKKIPTTTNHLRLYSDVVNIETGKLMMFLAIQFSVSSRVSSFAKTKSTPSAYVIRTYVYVFRVSNIYWPRMQHAQTLRNVHAECLSRHSHGGGRLS